MSSDRVALFEAKYIPVTESGCWLWTGGISEQGYGDFWVGKRHMRAHRFAYELFKGPIPVGYFLDHLCRVRCCVNPDHLEVVTHAENMRRGIKATSTTCKHGHLFTGRNKKQRICRTCHNLRQVKYAPRRRQLYAERKLLTGKTA